MLLKYIFTLLCCCVYSVVSVSNFSIKQGQRAELFELLDNIIPIVRITLPDKEFFDLKDSASNFSKSDKEFILPLFYDNLKLYFLILQKINFNILFPETNLNEIAPELQIDENGFAQFSIEQVNGFDYDPDHYKERNYELFLKHFFESNKNFKILDILENLDKIEIPNKMDKDEIAFLQNIGYFIIRPSSYRSFQRFNISESSFNNDIFINLSKKDFKTKNATMTFEVNKTKKSFKKVTLSLSGAYSREFPKPNYKIKIRGGQDLYGRKQFKFRADSLDPTYLRTKLMLYGDINSTTLYKCDIGELSPKYSKNCVNENDDVTDHTEWIKFLERVENAKSPSDLEEIFEVDIYLYEQAVEYLTDLGIIPIGSHNNKYSIFAAVDISLNQILILQDSSRFDEILKDAVNKVFNPATLFPRIDELKQFIKPYVELDKIVNSEGKYPGRINESNGKFYSMDEWELGCEFGTVVTDKNSYGIKKWILLKYRNVCKNYNIECDPLYLSNKYKQITTTITTTSTSSYNSEIPTEISTEIPFEIPSEISSEIPFEIPSKSGIKEIKLYNSSSSYIERETEYDVDVDVPTTDIENGSSSEEEEEEENKSKITITKTKTKNTRYKTIKKVIKKCIKKNNN
ncbi:hypothetical protein PIROE2DRAFT_8777 [Piromyces sp. E2]|nr:hypothetical protein PIROE2DRAFT_8777 [Piromyces sp. E2]|eukprot:OUM64466.1 hypothetical protein PIROE2DRAFT_8777 [Piromyces sp. E2]